MIKVATACFAASSYRSLNLQPVTILLELKAVWKTGISVLLNVIPQ